MIGLKNINKVTLNNVEVDRVKYDGTIVWEKASQPIVGNYMKGKIVTTGINEVVTIDCGGYIEWGDGTHSEAQRTHSYSTPSEYEIYVNVGNSNLSFKGCEQLTEVIEVVSNQTYMAGMFVLCTSLTKVPLFDTSNVTNMGDLASGGMFGACTSLTEVPQFDTSNVTSMRSMFNGCTSLTTVPLFDASKVMDMVAVFYNCSKLITLGGFNNLSVGIYLDASPLLTKDSLDNIINNLNDVTSEQTIYLTPQSYDILTSTNHKNASDKGWYLSDGSTKLQYLKCSNNQYIDTGVIPKSTMSMFIDFQPTLVTTNFMCGCRESFNNYSFSLANNWDANHGYYFQFGNVFYGSVELGVPSTPLGRNTMLLDLTNSEMNDVPINKKFTWQGDKNLSIYVGATNQNGVPEGRNFTGYIYKFYLLDGGSKIMELRPEKHYSTKINGFKDIYSGQFYPSISGTPFPN